MIAQKNERGEVVLMFQDIELDELKNVLKKPYCRQELSVYQKGLVKEILELE